MAGTIRESITTSATVDELSYPAECLFSRLLSRADSRGRFEADPRVLLATCFPLRINTLSLDTISALWMEIYNAGLVKTYRVGEKFYGYLVTWDKHASHESRRGKPRFPAPSDVPYNSRGRFALRKSAQICANVSQVDATDCSIKGNALFVTPVTSETYISPSTPSSSGSLGEEQKLGTEVETNTSDPTVESTFRDFYALYPRKEAPDAAEKAYRSAVKRATPRAIMDGLLADLDDLLHRERRFVPLPATWLNQGRWKNQRDGPGPNGTPRVVEIRNRVVRRIQSGELERHRAGRSPTQEGEGKERGT